MLAPNDIEELQGKNSRGWTITFDWFVNPTNFQKVLEGNYDRKGETKKIVWPGLKDVAKNTLIVLVICLIIGITDTVYPLGRGDEVRPCPEDYNPKRPLHLEIEEGESLELFIYVIPNTMPFADAIRQSPPFKMRVAVKGSVIAHNEDFFVNQWGGASIHLSL